MNTKAPKALTDDDTKYAVAEPTVHTIVEVTVGPDMVFLNTPKAEARLTPEQARELGAKLTECADRAERIDWRDWDNDDLTLVEYASKEDRPSD